MISKKKIDPIISAANEAIIKNDFSKAKSILMQEIKQSPYRHKIYLLLAHVFDCQGDISKSLQMKIQALVLRPQNEKIASEWEKLSNECEENGLYELCEYCCYKLQLIDPENKQNAQKRLNYLCKTKQYIKLYNCYKNMLIAEKDEDVLRTALNLVLSIEKNELEKNQTNIKKETKSFYDFEKTIQKTLNEKDQIQFTPSKNEFDIKKLPERDSNPAFLGQKSLKRDSNNEISIQKSSMRDSSHEFFNQFKKGKRKYFNNKTSPRDLIDELEIKKIKTDQSKQAVFNPEIENYNEMGDLINFSSEFDEKKKINEGIEVQTKESQNILNENFDMDEDFFNFEENSAKNTKIEKKFKSNEVTNSETPFFTEAELEEFGLFVEDFESKNAAKTTDLIEKDEKIVPESSDLEINLNDLTNMKKMDIDLEKINNLTKARVKILIEAFFGLSKKRKIRPFKMNIFEIEMATKLFTIYNDLQNYDRAIWAFSQISAEEMKFLPREIYRCKAVAVVYTGRISDLEKILLDGDFIDNPTLKCTVEVAEALLTNEMPSIGEKILKRAFDKGIKGGTMFLFLLGYCYYIKHDFKEAENFFIKAIEEFSNLTKTERSKFETEHLKARIYLSKIFRETDRQIDALNILKIPSHLRMFTKRKKLKKSLKEPDFNKLLKESFNYSKIFKKQNRLKLTTDLDFEREKCFLSQKMSLVAEKVFALAADLSKTAQLISETSPAVDELLNSNISSIQLFKLPKFVEVMAILIRVWRRSGVVGRRKAIAILVEKTVWFFDCSKFKNQCFFDGKNYDIVKIGAEEMLKAKEFEICYKALRICLTVDFPIDFDDFHIGSLFVELLEKTNYNLKYSRFIERIAKQNDSRPILCILMAIRSYYRRSYETAIIYFLKAINKKNPSPIALLYIVCCYLMLASKRNCVDKSRCRTIALCFLRRYIQSQTPNALAFYNAAICFQLAGLIGKALFYFEQARRVKFVKVDWQGFVKCANIPKINVVLNTSRETIIKLAEEKIDNLEFKNKESKFV